MFVPVADLRPGARNRSGPGRPVVRIYGDAGGAPLDPFDVDLSRERGVLIRPAV
jgi:hypothetical protein